MSSSRLTKRGLRWLEGICGRIVQICSGKPKRRGRAVSDAQTELLGFLDRPVTDWVPGPSAIFEGWAVSADGTPIEAVRAVVNGKSTPCGVYGGTREDVGRYLGDRPNGNRTGFWVEACFIQEENTVVIEFWVAGQGWIPRFSWNGRAYRCLSFPQHVLLQCLGFLSAGRLTLKMGSWNSPQRALFRFLGFFPAGRLSEKIGCSIAPKVYLKKLSRWKADYACWLDSPAKRVLLLPYVACTGWAVHWGGLQPARMRLRINRKRVVEGTHNLPRPDVAQYLQHRKGSESAMFTVSCVLNTRFSRCIVELLEPGRGWVPIKRFTVRCDNYLRPLPYAIDRISNWFPLHVIERVIRIGERKGRTLSPAWRELVRSFVVRLAGERRSAPHFLHFSGEDAVRPRSFKSPLRSKVILVRGWCLNAANPVRLRFRVNGRKFRCSTGIRREDVANVFNHVPGSLLSGFAGSITVSQGLARISFDVKDPNKGWIYARRRTLKIESVEPLWRASDWQEFRRTWNASFEKAWEALNVTQRSWMAAWLERLNACTILQLIQHEPKACRFDRLPKPVRSSQHLPKVTVVTPSYNQAEYLRATLDSVLSQEGVRVDYIVQDGGSGDGSADLIRSVADRLKFWTSAPDAGQADAVRAGFERTECGPDDIMAYLNSDDTFCPGALGYVAQFFADHPEVDVLYGHRIIIDEKGREIGRWVSPHPCAQTIRVIDAVPQETLFWRKRIYDKVGGMDASFRFALDWDLLIRFTEAGAKFVRVPYFLGCFRVHAAQKTSAQISSTGLKEMELLRERLHGRKLEWREIERYESLVRAESGIHTLALRLGLRT